MEKQDELKIQCRLLQEVIDLLKTEKSVRIRMLDFGLVFPNNGFFPNGNLPLKKMEEWCFNNFLYAKHIDLENYQISKVSHERVLIFDEKKYTLNDAERLVVKACYEENLGSLFSRDMGDIELVYSDKKTRVIYSVFFERHFTDYPFEDSFGLFIPPHCKEIYVPKRVVVAHQPNRF